MTIRGRLILLGTAAALFAAQSPALAAAHAPHQAAAHGKAKGHTHTHITATTTTPSPTKAYGKYCQGISKKHSDNGGKPGTPFSTCVTDLAKLAAGKSPNPHRACANLSHKKSHGTRGGTPYSLCVRGAEKMLKAMAVSSGASTPTTATPMAIAAPGNETTARDANTTCTYPDGTHRDFVHCYTPQDIRSAYGVDKVAPLANGMPNEGQGQTIVLVDAYGSPTATQDLNHFQQTFFPSEGPPNFTQVFPNGDPQYGNACSSSNGLSGPCAAANWSGEATLDIEWAYSIAPKAHIVLLAVPPAETEGVQGLPNLFKAISGQIDSEPAGTLFSMSFGVTEQTFGGAGASQTSKFDAVFQKGLAKHDNFFASSGDNGSTGTSKQHKDTTSYSYPTVGWPASSPYVTSVGGTQLQYGWTWAPTSNDPGPSTNRNPAYFNSTPGGDSQAVWNESYDGIATGGGASALYPRPSWQTADPGYGDHRLVPDTAWNAAVNGGVDVYITAYPQYNCRNATGCWHSYGGTSAASPQTAGLTALVNASRQSAGESPIGFLAPILYSGFGSTAAYSDIVPQHYGTAPKTFAGSDVGVSGPVDKSAGDLQDNQLWESTVAGYPTTVGYDATTGWGTPVAPAFVAGLTSLTSQP